MKLAVFTPLNPARCGVSDYSEALLPHLSKHFDVEVFFEGRRPAGFPGDGNLKFRPAKEFRRAEFGGALYQIGNNPHHIHAYDAALSEPGIAVLHEFNLHHLVAGATIKRGDWDAYMREVELNGGAEDRAHAKRVRALEVGPDYEGLAMNHRLIENSQALIVHSDFMVRELSEAGFDVPLRRIPHGAWIPEVNRNAYRARLGLDETHLLVGVFGFLKPYKRIAESLRALKRAVRLEPRIRMILVGEEHPDFPVRRLISQLDLDEFVRILGYVPADEFAQWIGAADVCLNLRYPTAGETSGTLLRALGLGRAVVVSDIGAFSDLPDDICFKAPVGEGEIDWITEYLTLLAARPEVGLERGARAREHVATHCRWPHVAELYAEWIRDVAEGRAASSAKAAPQPAENETDDADAEDNGHVPESGDQEPAEATRGGAGLDAPEQRRLPSFDALPAATPAENGAVSEESAALAEYILGFHRESPDSLLYLEKHLRRLVRTIELTPPGADADRVLEMGAYMQITPALKSKRGYGEVRGSYLGEKGKVEHHCVTSDNGEVFECDVDLFDAENDAYPYPDGHFATVLCCELLEHLQEDPMHMMSEISRVLQPGGRLLISTPNICSLRAAGAVLLGYHPGLFHQYIRPAGEGAPDPRHSREYAPRDLQELFEAAGFEVERMETGPYTDEKTWRTEWVKHLMKRYQLSSDLRGEVLYAVGKKVDGVKNRYPPGLYTGETH